MALHYTITPKDLHAHLFSVELTLDNPNPLGQVFSLPSWIPGSYLIRDFSKNIVSIEASSCNEPVQVKKLDKNHWITYPCKESIRLKYQVYAYDLSVRSAYLTNERAFFNGTSVFLLPIGFENESCQLTINPANEKLTLGTWSVATGLSGENGCYSAKNYEDLVDHPVEISDFTQLKFQVKDVDHSMVISGNHSSDTERLKQDLEKICKHQVDFFDQQMPFNSYVFLTLVRNNAYGGLEHKNSSSLICSRKDMPKVSAQKLSKNYIKFLALCSHEYFHAWWVKTIKPASFHQLDLNRENYTEQLWIFEGFTSYYDELSLLRTKLLSVQEYLDLFSQTVTRVQKSSGRLTQSLVESSYDAWTKFYQQDENAPNAIVSYYTKGALLAFVLDVEIRRKTNDKKSLDDVLKVVWHDYQDTGLENNTIQDVVSDMTQSCFNDFFAKYLYGVDELPLVESFNYLGVDLSFKHKEDDLINFGIAIKEQGKFSYITHVFANTCAAEFGLYVGDEIVSIDQQALSAKELPNAVNQYSQGKTITVGILRDKLLMEIPVVLRDSEPTFATLSIQSELDNQTSQRQSQWSYQG